LREPWERWVDAFVLAKLEASELTLAPDADRAALLRRATFDLIGLPPSPKELSGFLADPRADAYERVIDRLLASPHFGERWARRWLDAAGHVDITGGDNDAGIRWLACARGSGAPILTHASRSAIAEPGNFVFGIFKSLSTCRTALSSRLSFGLPGTSAGPLTPPSSSPARLST
jgi:hypothetical protein